MALSEDILKIINKLFIDEEIENDFLSRSDVMDTIENEYLNSFRDWEEYKHNKKSSHWYVPSGDKEGNEKDRRENYGLARTVSNLERFILKSEEKKEAGLLNKDGFKGEYSSLLLKYYHNKFSEEENLSVLLSFLTSIFDPDYSSNLDIHLKYLTVHGLFNSYNYSLAEQEAAVESFKEENPSATPTQMAIYLGQRYHSAEQKFKSVEKQKGNGKSDSSKNGFGPSPWDDLTNSDAIIDSNGYYINYESDDDRLEFIELLKDGLGELSQSLEYPLIKKPEGSSDQYFRKYFDNQFINNLVSSLAKERLEASEIEEVNIRLQIFLRSIGYTSEEIDRFLYLFVFPDLAFGACSPEPKIEEKEDEIECQDDLYEPIPADWTTAQENKLFFDEKSCSYVINFVTEYENTLNKKINQIQKEYETKIAETILNLLGKEASTEVVENIAPKIIFKSRFVPPTPLLKIKLLASLSKKELQGLGEASTSSDDEALTVSYNIKDFLSNMESFSDLMKIYEQRMVSDILKGNSLYYSDLNFQKESKMMSLFSTNISRLIRPVDIYENIDISFLGDKIVKVVLKRVGYKKRNITNGLQAFATSSPQTRSRTINFVKNISQIIEYFQANRSQRYDVFVETYFNPVPKKLNIKNNILNYADGAQKPIGIVPLGEIAKRSADFVASEVKRGLANYSCMTEVQKDLLEDDAQKDLENKKKFGEQLKVQIKDNFFLEAPEIFEKISAGEGKEAINKLGKDFLNRLGVCGIGDLVALAANTISSFMDPEEYMDELLKCAIKKMDPETARRFYNKINNSKVLNNLNDGTNFLNTYRNMVGDTLLPWESSSLNTPNTSPGLDENVLEFANVEDYSARIQAFGDSVVFSFDTSQLLNLLSGIPGGEWIRYFIELSDSIVRQCKVVNASGEGFLPNISLNSKFANLCEKKDKKTKIPKTPRVKSQKKKSVGEIIADNAKELVINLVVKLITTAFRELMKNVSAAIALDSNYFKKGIVLPDFLQNDQYFYNVIRTSSEKASITNEQINQMFLDTCRQMNIEGIDELGSESVGNFLSNTSTVLGDAQKIELLKGETSRSVSRNILEASKSNGVSKILEKDPSKIGDIFEKFGQNVNINKIEEDLANQVDKISSVSPFCLKDRPDDHKKALSEKGLTEEEISEQVKEKLERDLEQICNLSNMMSNPIAPIFGNAIAKLFSKDGPILGTLESEKFKVIKKSLGSQNELLIIPLREDLYNAKIGFLSLMLHDLDGNSYTGNGEWPTDSEATLAYNSFKKAMLKNTSFQFNSLLGSPSYSFKIGPKETKLVEKESGLINVLIGNTTAASYVSKAQGQEIFEETTVTEAEYYTATGESYGSIEKTIKEQIGVLNKPASNMFKLLDKKINSSLEDFDKNSTINKIVEENMPLLVEKYYGKIKRQMGLSKSFSVEDWQYQYGRFTYANIMKMLDISKTLDENLLLYQKLENDDRIGQRKKLIYESPFDMVLSKVEYIRISVLIDLMIRTYTVESIMKSFFSFTTFSSHFFGAVDILSSYIIKFMKEDLGDNYPMFINLLMQIYLTKINLGLQEIANEDAKVSYGILSDNLTSFREAEREDIEVFLEDNQDVIEDLVADFAEMIISSTVKSFNSAILPSINHLDQFALVPLMEDGPRDVVPNVNTSEVFDAISGGTDYKKTRIIMEKFIFIEEKEHIPFSIQSAVQKRDPTLFGVVNLNKWDTFLFGHKEDLKNYMISEVWSSWNFGLRLSYVMPKMMEKEDFSESDRQNNKAYNVVFNGEEMTLVPFAEVIRKIPNQKIPSKISPEYDRDCLIYDLTQSDEYKKMFNDIIDIETLISLITIYSVDEFNNFLGVGDEKGSDLTKWQKDPKSFTGMKEVIIEILEDF